MAGIASSLAQGFESGYGLGLRTDAANESKRRAGVIEANEAKQAERADAELGLRTRAQARLEAQQADAFERGRAKDVLDVTGSEIKDLIAAAAAGTATEDQAARYGHLQKVRQGAIDMFTRAKAGQADPKTLDPDDFYIATAMATGRTPEDIQSSPKYIADIQAGVEGKNPSLTIKGANGLLAPYLRRGVGEASPHGGAIARKEVIGLDPHPKNPDYLIPRLRVYVKTDDGAEKFYDAPMTREGSTAGDDQVVGINMQRAFDFMGNLGTLAAGLSERDIAQKLAQVSPQAKEQTQRWLTELNNRSKASQPKVGATEEKIRAIQKFAVENNVSFDEAARSIQAAGVTPGGPKALNPLQAEEIKSRIKVNEARAGKLGGGGGGGGSGGGALTGEKGEPIGDKRGDELLKSLSTNDAEIVRGIAEGRIKTTELSVKGNRRERIIALANRYKEGLDLKTTLKELPSAIQSSIRSNRDNYLRAARAFVLLEEDPNATGMKGYIPDSMLQRLDPKGVEARAELADLGSLIIHDRSGAAVTAMEFPRLAPFIPSPRDDPAVVKKKVRRFMEIYREETQAMLDAYGEDKGFKPPRTTLPGLDEVRATRKANVSERNGARPAAAAPAAAPAAGGAKYVEGQTATGPGGAKMVFKGGKWQPL